ncbi:MAG TPA: methionyl-tRNA formyltransferase [Desulfohalobiaceae bacterium]|nr:methionyl-tRNA formyltransferase [Desulfohalobiaceae bacterium]
MVQEVRNDPLRIVFLGTPGFAATVLRSLYDWPKARITAVVCQPDRPAGRGCKLLPPAVKDLAIEYDIPVFQPDGLNQKDWSKIASLNPDIFVVTAFGLIVPLEIIQTAPLGAINVHASLLPKYRGAAPIQRALQAGEKVTGITIMQMDEGMDTGDILLQRSLAIGIDDTAASLHDQLAEMGGNLLVSSLQNIFEGTYICIPQDEKLASYAPKLKKKEGRIDWNQPAIQVHNHIRAMHPWPGAFFDWQRTSDSHPLRLQIYPGQIGLENKREVSPGTIDGWQGHFLYIACADRYYLTPRIKPASGKEITGPQFYHGYLS